MNRLKLEGLTIFLLFFGVATLEALQTHDWIKAAFWLAIGTAVLILDNLRNLRTRGSSGQMSRRMND